MSDCDSQLGRYRRQMRFAPLGEEGQQQLRDSRVLICGSGALGCVLADTLVRAGVGFVRLVDRDFVDLDNLHRQVLFDENDATEQLPKAVAAARRLALVNSQVCVEPKVADFNSSNSTELAEGVDLILDGTDNFETRYLLNDLAVSAEKPWVFAGCVAAEGQVLTVIPGQTPCLTCLMPEPPPAAEMPTCESAGVLAPIVNLIASMQAMEAIKLLSGNAEAVNLGMTFVDLWGNQIRQLAMSESRRRDCPTCVDRDFPWLEGRRGSSATYLCGRNSVQLSANSGEPVNLESLAAKLSELGEVSANSFLLRVELEGHLVTVFADGRTIVGGTEDPAVARTVHAKYVGN